MSKFKKGLWYQCNHSLSYWHKGYYYYCPEDTMLKGYDDKPHRVAGFHYKHFSDGEVIRISAPMDYIQVNDCEEYKSPYLSDYRRRTDFENQLKNKEQ